MSDEIITTEKIEDITLRNRNKRVCEMAFIRDVAQKLQEKIRLNPGIAVSYSITEIVDAMQLVHLDRDLKRSHNLQQMIQERSLQEI
jgi:hypothetical protein